MIITPMVRNNICLNCHPQGCEQLVNNQITYVKTQSPASDAVVKKVLVIGGSTGYGLAGRIAAAYGWGADTLNVSFEKESSGKRPASVGLYNTKAFEKQARADGKYADSIFGDAFSEEIKQETVRKIANEMGQVDFVLYSIASPVRPNPETGDLYRSALKPLGETYTATSLNLKSRSLETVTIEPANEQETSETIKVMGGEDWQRWMEVLKEAGVLASGCITAALSYIGPEITTAVYRDGTIGQAKKHLEATAHTINSLLADIDGQGLVSVNKAVVTRSSAVIPVVPLYLGVLFKVMQSKGLHEGCIEQMYRLFDQKLSGTPVTDDQGRVRLDDYEMRDDVQQAVMEIWSQLTNENLAQYADIDTYEQDFLNIHGFGFDSIQYDADVPFQLSFDDSWVK